MTNRLCVECKHILPKHGVAFCLRLSETDLVTGQEEHIFCRVERTSILPGAHCGKEGKLWERRPPYTIETTTASSKPWWKFWR